MSFSPSFVCSRCLRATRQFRQSTILSSQKKNSPRSNLLATSRPLSTASTYAKTLSQPRGSLLRIQRQQKAKYTTAAESAIKAPSPPPAFQPETVPILNPQFSSSNQPLLISITPRAAHRLTSIMTKDSNPGLALRVTVESGGCHGFQYLMSLTDTRSVSLEDDTLFVYEKEGVARSQPAQDSIAGKLELLAQGKPKVVMDSASLELLEGSKVDYTMELIGSQFKIVDNPRATSSCGCGTSFDVNL